jgi:MarR family 2-MHQ and catechol resistance regulon transcriptional repressor
VTASEAKRAVRLKSDKREEHYLSRLRHHGKKYADFHRPTVELLVNLYYTSDVIESQFAREIETHNLSGAALNALMILSRCEAGCPMHELGELLLVSRANVTGLVDCLERKGLVKRTTTAGDRRVKLLTLTAAGRGFLEEFLPGHYAHARALLRGLTNKDKLELSRLLLKLRHAFLKGVEESIQKD